MRCAHPQPDYIFVSRGIVGRAILRSNSRGTWSVLAGFRGGATKDSEVYSSDVS